MSLTGSEKKAIIFLTKTLCFLICVVCILVSLLSYSSNQYNCPLASILPNEIISAKEEIPFDPEHIASNYPVHPLNCDKCLQFMDIALEPCDKTNSVGETTDCNKEKIATIKSILTHCLLGCPTL